MSMPSVRSVNDETLPSINIVTDEGWVDARNDPQKTCLAGSIVPNKAQAIAVSKIDGNVLQRVHDNSIVMGSESAAKA